MTLRVIDTFAGIGGFSLAAHWLGGFTTVQFVEREPFCQRILSKHWPTVPIHNDICTFNPERGSADVICGGFPCQDISQAGKGAGLAGSRSGLFYELLRVVRLVEPRYVVLENVAAITHRGMDAVLGALAEAGYDAEWACIPAAAVGACHQRDRWWCVAYAVREFWDGDRLAKAANSETHQQRQRAELRGSDCVDAADATGEQCDDLRAARSSGQAEPQSGDSDGKNAADTHGKRCGQPAWPDAPQRLNPDWRSYVPQPVLCRGDDGLSGRVDRLKALGNAVVPQVAMVPLARVLELERLRPPIVRQPRKADLI